MKTKLFASMAVAAAMASAPAALQAQEAFQDLQTPSLAPQDQAGSPRPESSPLDARGSDPNNSGMPRLNPNVPANPAPQIPFGTPKDSQSVPPAPGAEPTPAPFSDKMPGKLDSFPSQTPENTPAEPNGDFSD